MTDERAPIQPAVFLPLLIALIGLVILTASQTINAFYDYGALTAARAGQTAAVEQSTQLRDRLTRIAGGVAQLALSGDADAQKIVNDFAKNGIKFEPPSKPAK